MSQNGCTENILNIDQATRETKRTGKKLDFDQLKRLLNGADPQLRSIYLEFLKNNGKTQKLNTVQLAKTSNLVYDKRIMAEAAHLVNSVAVCLWIMLFTPLTV